MQSLQSISESLGLKPFDFDIKKEFEFISTQLKLKYESQFDAYIQSIFDKLQTIKKETLNDFELKISNMSFTQKNADGAPDQADRVYDRTDQADDIDSKPKYITPEMITGTLTNKLYDSLETDNFHNFSKIKVFNYEIEDLYTSDDIDIPEAITAPTNDIQETSNEVNSSVISFDAKKAKDLLKVIIKAKKNDSYNSPENLCNDFIISISDGLVRFCLNDSIAFMECTEIESQDITMKVDYKTFFNVIKQIKNDTPIEIEILECNWIKINSKWKLLFELSDYKIAADSDNRLCEIDVKKLKEVCERLKPFIAKNEPRKALEHIGVTKDFFVASDGHKLATYENDFIVSDLLTDKDGFSLSSLVIDFITNQGFKDDTLSVYALDKNNVNFVSDSFCIKTEYYKNFPNFEAILKDFNNPINFEVDKKHFLKQAKLASLLAGEKVKYLKVSLNDGVLKFHGNNPNQGEGEAWINVNSNGDNWNLGLNYTYIVQACNSIDSDTLKIRAIDHENPFVIQGADDYKFNALVMPMRLQ